MTYLPTTAVRRMEFTPAERRRLNVSAGEVLYAEVDPRPWPEQGERVAWRVFGGCGTHIGDIVRGGTP